MDYVASGKQQLKIDYDMTVTSQCMLNLAFGRPLYPTGGNVCEKLNDK